jgi:uroporphyrinogen-III decarboxylase
MDLAYGSAALERLRDRLHEFSLKEMELVAASDADAVSFMDDWGSQTSLLISPVLWRSFFKPLYKAYCDILHAKGKYVFFHSDGNIEAIYPDLIEIGVNAVNSQLFCMDMEALGAAYAGKIVFWGELDRQFVLPFGTKVEVEAAVARAVRAFIGKDGARQGAAVGRGRRTGVIAQMEWGIADPAANIETAFQAWDRV